ncbi:MAG: 4-phospho-D-threonate 3-dehydrogenase, partial [Deltaproteobacteria bacterium]
MGDPAGIGPEIIVKALGEQKVFDQSCPLVLGDESILSHTIHWMKAPVIIKKITGPEEGEYKPGILNLIPVTELSPDEIAIGRPQRKAGEAAYRYIEQGVKMAQGDSVA